jgi:tetrahydromethanopterin S-methyltransferase subunit D
MAQEAPNLLHAAAQFDGTGNAPVITRSRGIVDAGATKTGAGAYLLPLVDPVDPSAANAACLALDAGGAPLICTCIVVVLGPTDYQLGIGCVDAAGAPTDAKLYQVTLTKFATDD